MLAFCFLVFLLTWLAENGKNTAGGKGTEEKNHGEETWGKDDKKETYGRVVKIW
jgi:hypothetical protein